jgi:hypothetical protein
MDETRYIVGGNDNRPSVIAYTNTHVVNFIRGKNPSYQTYSRWYFAEGCLQTCMRQHDEYAAQYFEVVKGGTEDWTPQYASDLEYYKQYDGQARIHHVMEADQARKLEADLEAVVANLLFHAKIFSDGIAQLTLDMHSADPTAWPSVAGRVKKNDSKNLISDICKLLGRQYLLEAKAWMKGKPFDQGAMIRQLTSISDWRNARMHNMHLFVHPLKSSDGTYLLAYSDSINELRDPWTLRFTHLELGAALKRLWNFLGWWCWRAELHFNANTIRSWDGPRLRN